MPGRGPVLSAIGCLALLGVAAPAAMAGPFDGTYTGRRVLAKGDPSCPAEDSVSVAIKGGTLTFTDSNAKDYTISFDPHPDGSFAQLSANIAGTLVNIRGRVTGNVLDADVSSAHCQYHWHLQKP